MITHHAISSPMKTANASAASPLITNSPGEVTYDERDYCAIEERHDYEWADGHHATFAASYRRLRLDSFHRKPCTA